MTEVRLNEPSLIHFPLRDRIPGTLHVRDSSTAIGETSMDVAGVGKDLERVSKRLRKGLAEARDGLSSLADELTRTKLQLTEQPSSDVAAALQVASGRRGHAPPSREGPRGCWIISAQTNV